MPDLRKLAKEIDKAGLSEAFFKEVPHRYYDENMLHSVLLCSVKDFGKSIKYVEDFLPYIDNWASCDTLRPRAFTKHKKELVPFVKSWVLAEETYICRFGINMLMAYYLDEDFKPEYLKLVSQINREDYYVNMMIAWYFATALAKQWDVTIPYIEQKILSPWVHRKTIQKAVESRRISTSQKEYLKSFR